MNSIDGKKLLIKIVPIVLFFYLANKLVQAVRLAVGADISEKILNINTGFAVAFENPLPGLHQYDLIAGVVGAVFIALALEMKKSNAKKYRKGVEYGSARWGTANDIY